MKTALFHWSRPRPIFRSNFRPGCSRMRTPSTHRAGSTIARHRSHCNNTPKARPTTDCPGRGRSKLEIHIFPLVRRLPFSHFSNSTIDPLNWRACEALRHRSGFRAAAISSHLDVHRLVPAASSSNQSTLWTWRRSSSHHLWMMAEALMKTFSGFSPKRWVVLKFGEWISFRITTSPDRSIQIRILHQLSVRRVKRMVGSLTGYCREIRFENSQDDLE